jgi:hypothetical protein
VTNLDILLNPNFTLKDQSVPAEVILYLQKRGDGGSIVDGKKFLEVSEYSDVNIWDDNEEVSYENTDHSQISYATFNKLVAFLTSAENLSKIYRSIEINFPRSRIFGCFLDDVQIVHSSRTSFQ